MELVTILSQGGPYLVLAVLGYFVVELRKELREWQNRYLNDIAGKDGLTVQVLTALNASSNTLNSWREFIGKGNPG